MKTSTTKRNRNDHRSALQAFRNRIYTVLQRSIAFKCFFILISVCASLHVVAQENDFGNRISDNQPGDPYCLDSIEHLYVKDPSLALIRIDSLRRRCEANGWKGCSRPQLEMLNSLIYTYKEDQANTLRYAYAVLAVTEDLSDEDNLFWRLMALQYISTAYSSSGNWFMAARMVHQMETLAKGRAQYAWYESVSLMIRSQMLIRQQQPDQALKALDDAEAIMARDTSERGKILAFQNRLDTERFKAEINFKAGRLENSKAHYEELLRFVETGDSTMLTKSLHDLTCIRAYAMLCNVYQQLGKPDTAALYYDKVLDLQKEYREGHSVMEALSNYLFRSGRYNELERTVLPLLIHGREKNVISRQAAILIQAYIQMLYKSRRLAEGAEWTNYYMELNDSLQTQSARLAFDEFTVAYEAKEQENLILRQEHALFQHRIWFIFLIACTCLLLIGIGLTYYALCKYRRYNRFLYERIQEKNAAFEQLTKLAIAPSVSVANPQTSPLSEEQRTTSDVRHYLLEENRYLNKELSSNDVLRHCGLSHDTLNKRLYATIGMSLTEYINSLRLSHACKLLSETNLIIDAVADESGFNTTRTFLRQFKGKYNLSPTQYRKQQAVS